MKTTFLMILCGGALLLTGCAAGIKRTGYRLPEDQNGKLTKNSRRCPIAIQCNPKYEKEDVEVLGSIKAYETGLSTDCDEAYVLDIFCNEACALGADLVAITEEKRPDFWSTCYRAKADFLRFKDRDRAATLLSDAKFAPDLIIDRAAKANKRAREIIAASVIAGPLGGIAASVAPRDK